MRNWNVDDVLGSLLLERGKRQESRHFHQLFYNLRKTQIANARLDAVIGDLGHVDNLLDGHLRGSSVPVGLRSSRATHLVVRCGGWPPPVPSRRSAARDAAPSSASRSSECRAAMRCCPLVSIL